MGIDGCKAGWLAVFLQGERAWFAVAATLEAVLANTSPALVLLDMPIGLSGGDALAPDGIAPIAQRQVDKAVRALMPGKGSSVFTPPSRAALHAKDYRHACDINQQQVGSKLSKQAFYIAPKIQQVDAFLRAHKSMQKLVREAHPELCFAGLNPASLKSMALSGRKKALTPLLTSKKTAEGRAARMQLLQRHWPSAEALCAEVQKSTLKKEVALDDVLDAMCLALTAQLGLRHNSLETVTQGRTVDDCGLPMELVYARAYEL